MRNFSITNLEQSKRLYYAGLKLSTADYVVKTSFSKVAGVMNVTERPTMIEAPSDLKIIEDNQYYSAAWSLGNLIHMMPEMISSQYDKDGNDVGDDNNTEFCLIIEKNRITYRNSANMCHFVAYGSCLLDAAVDIIEKLLKDEYSLCFENE